MAKGEREQKLLDLRSERQQRAEEFEATELEIDTLRQSTTETMAAVEAQLAEDAALRAQLEAATAEEVQLQRAEQDAWRAALCAAQGHREAAAAEEAEAMAAQRLGQQQLEGTRQRVALLQVEVQQLQQQQGLGPAAEEEVQEVREEFRSKAEPLEEQRQATLWMERERQQRASRRLEQLRIAVRGLHEAEAHRSGG